MMSPPTGEYMNDQTIHPKVFVSYSWSGEEHEKKVLDLATTLRTHGVDAILDKWHLKPGQDKYVFMESMVKDANVVKVIVVCDKRYQEKADSRSGGVGTESQIISHELYTKVNQTKFIPIIFEKDENGEPCLPIFMNTRIFVDFSEDDQYGMAIDDLLRHIYNQPHHPVPALGSAPEFLKPDGGQVLTREFRSAIKAIQDGKSSRNGVERLFTTAVYSEISKLYCEPTGHDFDDAIVTAFERTKGLRDQLAEYFDTIAMFSSDDPRELSHTFDLLEKLGENFIPSERSGTYNPVWSDFYVFFALETLLLLTAALLRHEQWNHLKRVLQRAFLVRIDHSGKQPQKFTVFNRHLRSIDQHRNNRLKLNRLSVSTDILKERCTPDKTTFAELMQADIFLALKSITDLDSRERVRYENIWSPRTEVLYPDFNPLPIFMRAEEPEYRKNIRNSLGLPGVKEFTDRINQARTWLNDFQVLTAQHGGRFNFEVATNMRALTKD